MFIPDRMQDIHKYLRTWTCTYLRSGRVLKSSPFKGFSGSKNLHRDHAAVPQVPGRLFPDVAVSEDSVCREGHRVAGGGRRCCRRMEIVRPRSDVDVVLWRERGARRRPVRRITGGVGRFW